MRRIAASIKERHVADHSSNRVDRLAALVPQIAEWVGRRILDYERGGLA